MHTHMRVHRQTHTHTHTYMQVRGFMHVHAHMNMHSCRYTSHVHARTCACRHAHSGMCTLMHIQTCTHSSCTHTHTFGCSQPCQPQLLTAQWGRAPGSWGMWGALIHASPPPQGSTVNSWAQPTLGEGVPEQCQSPPKEHPLGAAPGLVLWAGGRGLVVGDGGQGEPQGGAARSAE